MRIHSQDKTIAKNYIKQWKFLIREYDLVKSKTHPTFKFASDFYHYHNIKKQNFFKYYHRFKYLGLDKALLPQKRGPKYHSRTPMGFIEQQVISKRKQGMNRYEIYNVLKPKLKNYTPSPSGIYNICKRHNLNILNKTMTTNKRKIIKENAGDMAHTDCHYLTKGIIADNNKRYYLVAVIDDATRLTWAEVVPNTQSITVMFAVMRCFNMLNANYNINFKEILTDNGSEFASPKKETHPFERMLIEMQITHRRTKPYRPQTNGKIERFWRTIEDELLSGQTFDNLEHLDEELWTYLFYYNEHRLHQGINGITPKEFNDRLLKKEMDLDEKLI
jgi:hypothetical protein